MEELNQENMNTDELNDVKIDENISVTPEKKDGVVGPIIGSLIIVILTIIGGIYYFNKSMGNVEKEEVTANNEIDEIISEDELNDVDAALKQIEDEINNAINQ